MGPRQLRLILLVLFATTGGILTSHAEDTPPGDINRSPVDVVLAPSGSWLVSVNQGSSTVSLIDTAAGRVVQELDVGQHPTAALRNRSGEQIFVSCRDSGTLHQFLLVNGKLKAAEVISVGFHPHGLAFSPDEKLLYVALTAADQVAIVDLAEKKIVANINTGRWPRWLAMSPDGKRLAVTASGDRGMSVIDCETRQQLFHESFAGLNIGHVHIDSSGKYAYFPWMVYRANPITENNIKIGWVLSSRVGRIKLDAAARREAFSLDPAGKAVADVHGLALSPDEKRLVVSSAGTHELLVYQHAGLPFKDYGGTDHIDPDLLNNPERFQRIQLGGRPLGLRIADDNKTVYIANYLHNSVQVVDLETSKLVHEIPLGSANELTLARRGETIFYDATRSLDQWYSCHSCHYEGGLSGERMDTTNDGTRNTFKTVLPLYNFDKTGPWTWHGWQTDPRAAMRKSLTETMLGPKPQPEDIDAMLAFFSQLTPPPNPFREANGAISPAAERGKQVFNSSVAGCNNCHSGPYFTDGENHDVGLGAKGDAYKSFNTPSLIGVFERVKLLHDGRAKNLHEVLTGAHNPKQVTGQGELSDEQLSDLIEYLKTL